MGRAMFITSRAWSVGQGAADQFMLAIAEACLSRTPKLELGLHTESGLFFLTYRLSISLELQTRHRRLGC
jgi:hypothetical protein